MAEELRFAMRPITWLHLSDVHLRPRDAWEQDVVLQAMCNDIRNRGNTLALDFVLLSGDLAFSGKPEEYDIAATFLDALSEACGVPTASIYCVPGNHDIDRDRQRMAFTGARTTLQDQNRTDAFLAPSSREELETLLRREEGYRNFQASYFAGQNRTPTDDGLAYVAHLEIEDVRLAIVALDSAWLAEGGIGDHGRLVIGERQIAAALQFAQETGGSPHVVLAMSHHPLHILQEFDRREPYRVFRRLNYVTPATMNRTGFSGGFILGEDGVDGKTESVFTGGTGACGSAGAGARARA